MLEWFRRLFVLPPAASQLAGDVDALHLFVIGTGLIASLAIVMVVIFYSVRYRQRGAVTTTPAKTSHGTTEAMVVGTILALFLSWWYIGFRQYVRMQTVPADATVVYVTAKQWTWKFTYTNGESANDVLTVEEGRPVELIMTSRDVIHSLFVPALRMKQDVLPGRYVTFSFEASRAGTYPIYCAEFCGVSHSNMRAELRVLSADDFAQWLRRQNPTEELVDIGRNAAVKRACFACHTADGQPHVGPTWSRLFKSKVLLEDGREVIADEGYLTRAMMEPQSDVVKGYPPTMPSYRGVIDAVETAALVRYIRSLADGPVSSGVALPAVGGSSSARDGHASSYTRDGHEKGNP